VDSLDKTEQPNSVVGVPVIIAFVDNGVTDCGAGEPQDETIRQEHNNTHLSRREKRLRQEFTGEAVIINLVVRSGLLDLILISNHRSQFSSRFNLLMNVIPRMKSSTRFYPGTLSMSYFEYAILLRPGQLDPPRRLRQAHLRMHRRTQNRPGLSF